MLPILKIPRLRLRPRVLGDLDANLAMDLDPAVHRYIWDRPPNPREHRAELVRRIESGWPHRGGIWAVEEGTQPGFLGWCGLFALEDSGLIELGYRYRRQAWGRGIAAEAARAVLAHGFGALGIDPIVAVTHPDNGSSRRVLEKTGFQRAGTAFHYGKLLDYFHFARADFERATPPRAIGQSHS